MRLALEVMVEALEARDGLADGVAQAAEAPVCLVWRRPLAVYGVDEAAEGEHVGLRCESFI